jgi:hypothetical protein
MLQSRMILDLSAGANHLAILIDLGSQRLGTIKSRATLRQHFNASDVGDVILDGDVVPQPSALVAKGARRLRPGCGCLVPIARVSWPYENQARMFRTTIFSLN